MSRERILHLNSELSKIAKAHHAHLVVRDADETPHLFGADAFHLNTNGHRSVFNEIWSTYRSEPCATSHARRTPLRSAADAGTGLFCALGEEVEPLVADAVGFAKVNLAPPTKAPKIGWSAASAGASLTLCTALPRDDYDAKVADFKERIMWLRKDRQTRPLQAGAPYKVSVGFQVSHPRNRPLFGEATVTCYGACNCTCAGAEAAAVTPGCSIDTLHNASLVTVTAYLELDVSEQPFTLPAGTTSSCAADACIIRVRNAAAAAAPETPPRRRRGDRDAAEAADGRSAGDRRETDEATGEPEIGGRSAGDRREIDKATGEPGGRFRVVVRALIVALNDWRSRQIQGQARGSLKDVRRRS